MMRAARGTALLVLGLLCSCEGNVNDDSVSLAITSRVSLTSAGAQAFGSSDGVSISANGRYIAFHSNAANLVPGDTNGTFDCFVKDMQTGDLLRVSVPDPSTGNAEGNFFSLNPSISADGRYVAFQSNATNLTADDADLQTDIFIRDLVNGTTTLVTAVAVLGGANGSSEHPAISDDGRYVAFESEATNFGPTDTNAMPAGPKQGTMRDIYLRDMLGGFTLLSINSGGTDSGNGESRNPRISANGELVVFDSAADNLVAGDVNQGRDVFLRKWTPAASTEMISVDSNEVQAFYVPAIGDESIRPAMSADGNLVVFESDALTLVTDDSNFQRDIFLRDRALGTTTRVSLNSRGNESVLGSSKANISRNGSFVVFVSGSPTLAEADANGANDVFLRALATGVTTRVSVGTYGTEANSDSDNGVVTDDGKQVYFTSFATNLVGNDTNGNVDIFRRVFP